MPGRDSGKAARTGVIMPLAADWFDRAATMVKRWFVWVPLLALTVFATWQVSDYVPPSFESAGSVMLLPPTGKATAAPGKTPPASNSWTMLGPADLATAIIHLMDSGDRRAAVETAGFEPSYFMRLRPKTSIIEVEASSSSPSKALGTVKHVLNTIAAEVAAKQASLGENSRLKITTQILAGTDQRTADSNELGVRKAQLIVAASGLALTVVALIAAEFVARAWRRRAERAVRGVFRDRAGEAAGAKEGL